MKNIFYMAVFLLMSSVVVADFDTVTLEYGNYRETSLQVPVNDSGTISIEHRKRESVSVKNIIQLKIENNEVYTLLYQKQQSAYGYDKNIARATSSLDTYQLCLCPKEKDHNALEAFELCIFTQKSKRMSQSKKILLSSKVKHDIFKKAQSLCDAIKTIRSKTEDSIAFLQALEKNITYSQLVEMVKDLSNLFRDPGKLEWIGVKNFVKNTLLQRLDLTDKKIRVSMGDSLINKNCSLVFQSKQLKDAEELYPCYLVVIDEDPLNTKEHEVRYAFVSPEQKPIMLCPTIFSKGNAFPVVRYEEGGRINHMDLINIYDTSD